MIAIFFIVIMLAGTLFVYVPEPLSNMEREMHNGEIHRGRDPSVFSHPDGPPDRPPSLAPSANTRAESELIEDKYKLSSFFTHQDSFFFSYFDETTINLSDPQGNLLDTMYLNTGEYKYNFLDTGTYFVNGTEKFSILIGDPTYDGVCGFFVLDENGFGTFTNAYTIIPKRGYAGRERIVVIAQEDNTEVTLTQTDNGQLLWEGVLNAGEYYINTDWHSIPININSTNPVSCNVLFDSGFFYPAVNGLFSGKKFYTYVYAVFFSDTSYIQDFPVIAYEDDTQVTIKHSFSGDVYWSGTLNEGEIYVHQFQNMEVPVTVEATKNVTVGNVPSETYPDGYHHLTFVPDKSGSGIGTEIYTTSEGGGFLYVFSYFDDTHFKVYNANTGSLVSQHVINKGEALNVNPGYGYWKIISEEKPISCLEGYGAQAGSSHAWPLFGGAYPHFDIIPKQYEDGSKEPLVKHTYPGKTVHYNLTVVNRYERDATIKVDLSVPSVPKDWEAWLDKYTVSLERGGWEDFTLFVKAPYKFEASGDLAFVNVTGLMTGDMNVTDKTTTITILEPGIDFEMSYLEDEDPYLHKKVKDVKPGTMEIVNARVTNTGYINDSYTLSLEGVPGGWDVSFSDSVGNIHETDTDEIADCNHPIDNSYAFPIFVTPPPTAMNNEIAVLTVVGVSDAGFDYLDRKIERSDDLTLRVIGQPELRLQCEENEKWVGRGKSVDYEIKAVNDGNANLNVDLQMSGGAQDSTDPRPDFWGASLSMTSFNIGARSAKFVKLTVTAPTNGMADERLILALGASGTSTSGDIVNTVKAENIQVTTIILPAYELNATADRDEVGAAAGGAFTVNVSIENTGNTVQSIQPLIDMLGENWQNYSFTLEGYEVNVFDLDPGGSTEIKLTVGVPFDAVMDADRETPEIDPYRVVINVSGEKVWVHLEVKVSLKQVHEFRLGINGKQSREIDPGNIVVYKVELENQGNWIDDVRLEFADHPNDWLPFVSAISTALVPEREVFAEYGEVVDTSGYLGKVRVLQNSSGEFEAVDIRMAPGQLLYIDVGVIIPKDAEDKIYDFSVLCTALDPPEKNPDNNEVSFETQVRISDPMVKDVSMPDELVEGELVTIRSTIHNSGDIACTNVKVRLLVDGKVVDEQTIVNIPPGGSAVVTFTWRVKPGAHKIKVELDPDSQISEQREDNNQITEEINAKSSGLFGLPGFEAPLMALALLSSVLIAAVLMTRRRPGGR